MRRPLTLAVALTLGLGACGGSDKSGSISPHDLNQALTIQDYVRQWNDQAGQWLAAYQSGNLRRFRRTVKRLDPQLNAATDNMTAEIAKIEGTRLRSSLASIAALYHREFDELVNLQDHALAGEVEAARRSEEELRRLGRKKAESAAKLVQDYPALA